jgi:predicted membrane protein
MKQISYLIVVMFAALFILLSFQAEPVTATLGFIAAGMLMLSLIASVVKGK